MRDVIQSELSVGGRDQLILELNKEAFDEIKVEKQLIIVPEATHLFKEPAHSRSRASDNGLVQATPRALNSGDRNYWLR
jgi:hypothetical protein